VLLRLYGAGVAPGPRRGAPGPRDPGRGLPGNRGAPARGVDVKPPLRDPGTGPGDPLEGLRRALRRVSGPREGSWPARGLGGPGTPGPGGRPRGVLHQPLAPGPRGTPGRPGGPSGAREPKIPDFGDFPRKGPFLGPPGGPRPRIPKTPKKGLRGPGARGWCKTPPRGRRKVPKSGQNGHFREKVPKSGILAKNAKNRDFWGILAPPGLPGTPPGRGFYINPSRRGPAVPGAGVWGPSAAQAPGEPRIGARGVSPLGSVAVAGLTPAPVSRTRLVRGKASHYLVDPN